MVKISVLYPSRPGARFDADYYLNRHMKLAGDLVGPYLKAVSVERGIDTPQGPAPFVFVANMWFESMETMQAAMNTHGPALMADIPNYTDIQPVIQLSSVVFGSEPASAQAAG